MSFIQFSRASFLMPGISLQASTAGELLIVSSQNFLASSSVIPPDGQVGSGGL